MMTDWKEKYSNLPESELDKIAVLRVMECTNGVIQYAFRDKMSYALSIEETRQTMKFSMGCIKRMEIPLKDETITFLPETEELMRQARDLYIRGTKHGDDEAYSEFMKISEATAQVCGMSRILKSKKILEENVDIFPDGTLNWGVEYLMRFFSDEYLRDFFQSVGIRESAS
tara:strand:- start:15 stop:527 length:513 start_codon:yes stop_codon:yes gene_type:complete